MPTTLLLAPPPHDPNFASVLKHFVLTLMSDVEKNVQLFLMDEQISSQLG